jgi:hypothetical protein
MSAHRKIAEALEAVADHFDAAPPIQAAPAVQETKAIKTASEMETYATFYRQRTGKELPEAIARKLASGENPELTQIFSTFSKTAGLAPEPMGDVSDTPLMGVVEPRTRDEYIKLANDEFEAALFADEQ